MTAAAASAFEAHNATQDSIDSWGRLLIALGGALKPIKCFFHLISFKWKPDGRWLYEKNEENEDYDIGVPMPDGTYAQIEHASVDTPKETLGVWTCPTGNASGALVGMKKKAQEWVDRAKEGHLKRRDIWFLVDNQFWPKVGYGLCSNTATFETLTTCLDKQYFELLPLGGIIRTAKKGLRQTSRGFMGQAVLT